MKTGLKFEIELNAPEESGCNPAITIRISVAEALKINMALQHYERTHRKTPKQLVSTTKQIVIMVNGVITRIPLVLGSNSGRISPY